MLRAIVICPERELSERLKTALQATGEITIHRVLDVYPAASDLMRVLRGQAPEVVFLSFESIEKAQELVRELETEAEGVQIVAIHRSLDARVLRETMRAGVRECLTDPFEPQAVLEALTAVKAQVQRKPPVIGSTSQVFAFLPSKAGVGTSTIALNVSAAMARRPDTRVLLSDFDLNSGMLRFMLKLENEYSVLDAAENSPRIDEGLWPQLVTSFGNLDVLHAGRVNPNLRIEGAQVRSLVEFMRRNYQAVCFDLSGNLERYSLEIMKECTQILLVCTPEIASLHLAREKMGFLRGLDLAPQVSLVLNRVAKKSGLSKAQVEEILGAAVITTFPNDYHGVHRALHQGTFMAADSDLGKGFSQFANDLLGPHPKQPELKKKFIEFFAVSAPRALVPGQK